MPTAVKSGDSEGMETSINGAGTESANGSRSVTRTVVDGIENTHNEPASNNGNHSGEKPQELSSSTLPVTRNDYERMKRDLKELLAKKRGLDKNLNLIEGHLYKAETAYLEDTPNGNIVRGFDNYIKGTGSSSRRRTGGLSDADRIFSGSSISLNRNKQDFVDLDNTKPDS